MDIFRNEQTRVDKRIEEVVPQLEEVGLRGQLVGDQLYKIKNALKHPASSGNNLIGSDLNTGNVNTKLEEIKNELDVYAEKSRTLIADLTKILTDIRFAHFLML